MKNLPLLTMVALGLFAAPLGAQEALCADRYNPVILESLDARLQAMQLEMIRQKAVSDRVQLEGSLSQVADMIERGVAADEAARVLYAMLASTSGSALATGEVSGAASASFIYRLYKTLSPGFAVPGLDIATRAKAQAELEALDEALKDTLGSHIAEIDRRIAANRERNEDLEARRQRAISDCVDDLRKRAETPAPDDGAEPDGVEQDGVEQDGAREEETAWADWNLGKPQFAGRSQVHSYPVPDWARQVKVQIGHGYDNSGDRCVEVAIETDADSVSGAACSEGKDDFMVQVAGGGMVVVTLSDQDTDTQDSYPGNGGDLRVIFYSERDD